MCIAKVVAKKEKLDNVLKVFSDLKNLSPTEDGCLRYELYQDQENPLIFTFVDRFKDAQAFEYHCEQEYTAKYFDNILPNLVDSMADNNASRNSNKLPIEDKSLIVLEYF